MSFPLVIAQAWELRSPASIPSCVCDLLWDFSVPQFCPNNGVTYLLIGVLGKSLGCLLLHWTWSCSALTEGRSVIQLIQAIAGDTVILQKVTACVLVRNVVHKLSITVVPALLGALSMVYMGALKDAVAIWATKFSEALCSIWTSLNLS